jgi:hypothetical protein
MSVDTAEDENFFPYRGKGLGQRAEIVILFKSVAGRPGILLLVCPFGQLGSYFSLGVLLTKEIDEGGAGDIEKLKIKGMFLRKGVPELP